MMLLLMLPFLGDSSEKDVISKLFLLDLVVVHVLQKKVYLDRPS